MSPYSDPWRRFLHVINSWKCIDRFPPVDIKEVLHNIYYFLFVILYFRTSHSLLFLTTLPLLFLPP